MIFPASTRAKDEGGAILLLALVFILLIAISILGLLTFGGSGIKDAAGLAGQRGIEAAAESATTSAIEAVRYTSDAFGTSPTDCLPGGGQMTIPENSVDYVMEVDCAGAVNDAPVPVQFTRVVTFYACQSLQTLPCTQGEAILVATVSFEDLSPTGVNNCSNVGTSNTASSCGTAMVINTWNVQSVDD